MPGCFEADEGKLAAVPESMRQAPLKRPIVLYKQWVDGADAFRQGVEATGVKSERDQLETLTAEVERFNPRWGEVVTDTAIADAEAQLMIMNEGLAQLPQALRRLEQHRKHLGDMCKELGVAAPEEHVLLRDAFSMAGKSLDLGRRTLAVTASLKVALAENPKRQDIQACLDSVRSSLPAALASRLS